MTFLRGAALFFLSPLVLVALFLAVNFGAQGEVPGCVGSIIGALAAGGGWSWAKAREWNDGWRAAKLGGRIR